MNPNTKTIDIYNKNAIKSLNLKEVILIIRNLDYKKNGQLFLKTIKDLFLLKILSFISIYIIYQLVRPRNGKKKRK